ncbi:hypothetical protein PAXRUDRAFT_138501 [Paxillus rubicundulus Ve08.2h10]|uniref:Unplaced genomic scaffold scaffold_165, whole genome shotgun sequence n=1 Tax=Paxillus rubicundulus Ve08.2h10 TaxID=930991 RepID=A0A0D0E015_9AGAM|nr:hypothetical protein PAXRUDRAFT_138501 [Paxillus rubicundulus Ve08.2h10]
MWDLLTNFDYISHLYLLFTTADGPGLIYWDGMVGHSGKNGCCLYCGVWTSYLFSSTHYYPVLLCPHDHIVAGSELHDFNVFNLPEGGSSNYGNNLKKIVFVHNQTQWDKMKTETSLMKPPLILGLHPTCSLGFPLSITTDIMHLAGNISNLLLSLWNGTIDVAPNDDCALWDWAALNDRNVWIAHGQDVENAGQHLSGPYNRKPCNIANKINTQYKRLGSFNFTPLVSPPCFYMVSPL